MSGVGGSVAVIIVSYGSSALVLAQLGALRAELARFDRAHAVIVDNFSPGGDGARLAEGLARLGPLPEVTFLQSAVNGGFAAGNNLALDTIRALGWTPDAVLLLNPDAEMRPGALVEMMRFMAACPRAGFVGPRLENPDGSTWVNALPFPSFGREVFNALGIDLIARHFRTVIPDSEVPVRADWVTGAALLIRWRTLEELGPLDEGYFLYYEEVDYQRDGARRGWECWHVPAAVIGHIGGATTEVVNQSVGRGRMPAYWFQSYARYFAKNHGALYARLTSAGRLVALILGDAQRALRGRGDGRPERYYRDFLEQVVLARFTPLPGQTPPNRAPERGAGAS